MEDNHPRVQQGQPVGIVSPETPQRKKGKKKAVWIILGLVFVVIAGLVGFYILGNNNGNQEEEPSPTPFVSGFDDSFTDTATPEPEVDKDEISIEVLNGTGISGEAGFLQGKLANLGYTDIEVGNADDQDNEITQVTFSSSLSETIKDEILEELESIYKEVNDKTSSTLSVDIQVVTGLQKGATPKAEATPTPEATTTPTTTASPTPTATPAQ